MHKKAYLLLLATTLFWAGNAIAGKLAVGHVSPMLLNTARWGFMLAILLVVGVKHLARDWPVIRRHWWFLLFTGAVGFTGFSVAMYSALVYTSATNVSCASTTVCTATIGTWIGIAYSISVSFDTAGSASRISATSVEVPPMS